MQKRISILVLLAFPLGFIGAIVDSYYLRLSGDATYREINIWVGGLIGSVTALSLVGFLSFVHWKLFPVPSDLFNGPMFGEGRPLFEGNPAIFRQALVTVLCLSGAGLGLVISAPIFNSDTLGIGMTSLIPGAVGTAFVIGLWRRMYRGGSRTPL